MSESFTVPQESIAGLPIIEFQFNGDVCKAALSGATLYAEREGDTSARLRITDGQGSVLADVTAHKVANDATITETVLRVGSAILWSHHRYVDAMASREKAAEPHAEPVR